MQRQKHRWPGRLNLVALIMLASLWGVVQSTAAPSGLSDRTTFLPVIAIPSGSRQIYMPLIVTAPAPLVSPVSVVLSTDHYHINVQHDDSFNLFVALTNTSTFQVDAVYVTVRFDSGMLNPTDVPNTVESVQNGSVTLLFPGPLLPGNRQNATIVFSAQQTSFNDQVVLLSGSYQALGSQSFVSGTSNTASVQVLGNVFSPPGSFSCVGDGIHSPLGVQPASGRGSAGTNFVFAAFDTICGANFAPFEEVSLWSNHPDGSIQPLDQVIADGRGNLTYQLGTNANNPGCYSLVASSQDERYQLVGAFIIDPTNCTTQVALRPSSSAPVPAFAPTQRYQRAGLGLGGLRGNVRSVAGVGLAGVLVIVRDHTTGQVLASTMSAADGSYIIPAGLPSGNNDVSFHAARSAVAASAAYASKTLPISITEPTIAQLNATLDLGASISGTITAAGSTSAIADVAVLVRDANSGQLLAQASSDASGQYSTPALPSGSYRLTFDPTRSHQAATNAYVPQAVAAPVVLTAPTLATQDVMLSRCSTCGQISGLVTAQESGAGLADVAVLVTAPSGQVISIASTDVTGHYDALVPSGSYRVTFFNDYAHVAATRQHLDGSYAGGIVTVTAPGMTLGINAAFAVGAQISGRITNTSGEPLRDMLVRVVDPAGILITTTLTDLDGHYITPGLAAGAYQLSFQPAPGSRAPEYARVTASLSVAAAEQHTGFDVVLSH